MNKIILKIKKNSNIRTFYKHKNSNMDKKISQNLRFNIIETIYSNYFLLVYQLTL